MKLTRILAILAMAGTFGASVSITAAHAQIREQQPAEFPGASYKGKQYVDSQGCVFIRAGIDGNVSWVPRVTRDRKTVCGFKPSVAARAPAPAAVPAPAPVQITVATPAPAPAPAQVVKPAPRRVASVAAPAPKPRRVAAPVVVRQTAPRPQPTPKPRVVVAAPKPVAPAPQVRRVAPVTQVAGGCQGASAISSQYLRGEGVRCGPQTQPIVAGQRRVTAAPRVVVAAPQPAAVQPVQVAQNTRIVPKHVAKRRLNTTNVAVPHGYKRVWQDGRLNPKRAEQTLAGRSQMLLVWTNTAPQRLINQATGRDVTASVPLVYPYTSIAQQRRELGEVTIVQHNGKTAKRIKRNAGVAPVARHVAKPVVRQPVYSTRSAPKPAAPAPSKALAGKRYVQVGTFRNAGNAQRTAQNIANLGMRARIGKHRKGGKTYMTVQAGPFNGARAMQSAMGKLRSAGYSDAFAR